MMAVIGVIFLALVFAVAAYMYVSSFPGGRCLNEEERAMYTIVRDQKSPRFQMDATGKRGTIIEHGSPGLVQIDVINTRSSTTVLSKQVEVPSPKAWHSYHLGRCGFYLIQAFNANYDTIVPAPPPARDYSFELWKFSYFSDSPKQLIILAEQQGETRETYKSYYSSSFTIDPTETYISLERSYLEKPDYALVVKSIQTGKDVYVLTLADLLKQHPSIAGSFDVGEWYERPDGSLVLAGNVYQDRYKPAFYLLEAGTWTMHIWPTPEDFSGYSEFAIAKYSPYLAYTDFDVFGGIDIIEDQVFANKVARGDTVHLKVANLETGKTNTIAEIPLIRHYRFNLTWLSETELRYTLPDGTTRTYTVE